MATEVATINPPNVSETDELFAALDRRVIGDDERRWVVEALRIHHDELDWWIDIASTADASASVILCLSRRATAAHAIAALHAWRPATQQPTPVINVMRCCQAAP